MPTSAAKPAPAVDARAAIDAIPRAYNFAADILGRNIAAGRADKPAYIDPRGSWTYGQLAERVDRFGRVLRSLGIRREERIMLALLDTIDWPTAFLGAIKAGIVPVPVNTLMTEDDYRFMLADSRAKVLVVSEALFPKFANLIGSSPDLVQVIVSGDERARPSPVRGPDRRRRGPSPISHRADHARRHLLLALHLGLDRQAQGRGARPRQSAAHRRPLCRAACSACKESDVCYSVAKLFFAYGLGNALTFPMAVGATTRPVAGPARRPSGVAAILRQHPVTVFYAVPTFYAALLASPSAPQRSDLKLRYCISAGEALPPDVGRRWKERYGVDILDGIGSTEMLHIFLSNYPGDVKYGTTGKPVPGYDIRLVDDDGNVDHEQGRDGRAAGARPDRRGHVLEQPREDARDVPGRMDALRRQISSRTRTATTSTAGGATTCSRSAASMSRRSRSKARSAPIPTCWRPPWSAWPDEDALIKPKAFVVLKAADKAGDEPRARAAGARQGRARALQISALDRVPHRAAEDRDRQDPALQAAGGSNVKRWSTA